MPRRDWRLRVADVLQAIGTIQTYTEGMTFDAFSADERTIHAVLYNVAITGEAVGNIPDDVKQRHPDVPWTDIRNMRNRIVHVYERINRRRAWNVVMRDLAPLAEQLQQLLQDEDETIG